MHRITQLRHVIPALFEQFTDEGTASSRGEERDSCGNLSFVMTGRTTAYGERKDIRFIEDLGIDGRHYRQRFQIFSSPLSDETPLFRCYFATDDPPYDPKSAHARWEEGRGYWVSEYLYVECENHGNHRIEVVRSFNEFRLILAVQEQIYRWIEHIPGRGHWQSEWHPQGNYRTRVIQQ